MSDDRNFHGDDHNEDHMEETHNEGTAYTAQEFVTEELAAAKKNLAGTQIWGSAFVLAVACVLGGIANGFATNLAPKEAAKITKGLVMQRLDGLQEQASNYLKEQIPSYIEQAPEWAMAQLPEYRTSLENKLEEQFHSFASEASGKLDTTFDAFIEENADQFKTLILEGQDQATTDEVAAHLRDSFMAYLSEPGEDGESVQDKFDESLKMLDEIEQKTHYLAFGKDLSPVDQKTRRALAVLFGTITENADLMPIPKKEDIQDAISSNLPESAENTAEGDTSEGDDTPAASAPAHRTAAPAAKTSAPAHARAAYSPAPARPAKKLTAPVVLDSNKTNTFTAKDKAIANAKFSGSLQFGGKAKPNNGPSSTYRDDH